MVIYGFKTLCQPSFWFSYHFIVENHGNFNPRSIIPRSLKALRDPREGPFATLGTACSQFIPGFSHRKFPDFRTPDSASKTPLSNLKNAISCGPRAQKTRYVGLTLVGNWKLNRPRQGGGPEGKTGSVLGNARGGGKANPIGVRFFGSIRRVQRVE